MLISKNIPFQEFKLGQDFTRDHLLEQYPDAKSFPVVVIDGFYIGGADQLSETISRDYSGSEKFLTE